MLQAPQLRRLATHSPEAFDAGSRCFVGSGLAPKPPSSLNYSANIRADHHSHRIDPIVNLCCRSTTWRLQVAHSGNHPASQLTLISYQDKHHECVPQALLLLRCGPSRQRGPYGSLKQRVSDLQAETNQGTFPPSVVPVDLSLLTNLTV